MLEFTEELRSRSAIYAFMCEHGKNLRSDRDFKKQIKVKHLDESTFELFSCSWDESEDKIFIWTEHCGYLYFFKEDIEFLDIQEWEWHEEEEDEEKRWKIVEHTIINFNMESKPNSDDQG